MGPTHFIPLRAALVQHRSDSAKKKSESIYIYIDHYRSYVSSLSRAAKRKTSVSNVFQGLFQHRSTSLRTWPPLRTEVAPSLPGAELRQPAGKGVEGPDLKARPGLAGVGVQPDAASSTSSKAISTSLKRSKNVAARGVSETWIHLQRGAPDPRRPSARRAEPRRTAPDHAGRSPPTRGFRTNGCASRKGFKERTDTL